MMLNFATLTLIKMTVKKFVCGFFFLLFFLTSNAQRLPSLKAVSNDPSLTGYYFLSSNYAGAIQFLILDNSGSVLYYKPIQLERIAAYNFSLNANGLISYTNNRKYFFMDSSFALVDSVECSNLYRTDPHDMRLMPNGHYLLLGADTMRMDLSSNPLGKEDYTQDTALLRRAVIQELDQNKKVIFEWHAKDYFALDDVDTALVAMLSGVVDVEHVNALEIDKDGNLLLSSRNFSEITKINRTDGSVIWRFGGKRNQFEFIDCLVPFYGQHDIRRINNGHITLFDGGHHTISHGARALEFELDEIKKTARLVWSYTYNDTMKSMVHGNVQRLNDGYTLVNYGGVANEIVFVVVNKGGGKLFQLSSPDHVDSYRSFYYPSLPWQLKRPQITCFDSLGVRYLDAGAEPLSYQWNTGDSTRIIPAQVSGEYFVFVPYGDGAFIGSGKFRVADSMQPCSGSRPMQKPVRIQKRKKTN